MKQNKNLGSANNYEWGKNFYDTLETCFQNLKVDINGRHGWNRPIEQMDGLTMSFLGPAMVKINHVKYIVSDPYNLTKKEIPEAKEFIDAIVAELKKRYRSIAKTAVNFKMKDEQQDTQLYSKLSADRSWALGGSYGVMIARYMMTTSRIYEVSSSDIRQDSSL